MKKMQKSFLLAFTITSVLHLLSILVLQLTNQFSQEEATEIYENLPLSFSLFFFPIFFSHLFFDERKSFFLNILIPASAAVIFNGLYEIIHFTYLYSRPNFGFFDVVFFRVISISFIVVFFVILFQRIKISYFKNSIRGLDKIEFSWKIIISIPFLAGLIYSLIIAITGTHINNAVIIWINLFPLGIILSILTTLFLKSTFYNNSRYNVFIFYFLNILFFTILAVFTQLMHSLSIRPIGEIITKFIIPSSVLYSPYFLFIIGVIHYYFLRLLQKQQKIILKQQSLESQLNYQQLKNQISPHFLFNNINVLTSLIEENPKKAVKFSENLSHIYRYFLEQEKQDVVKIKNELDFAKSYLELLKDRFEVGLNFTITIEENIKEKYIVSTILQQVLENVIKHNEINETHLIEVKISSKDNYMIIKNNKKPKLKTEKSSKKGIENIKKRITFFTDEKVIVEDLETNYIIKLPILETV